MPRTHAPWRLLTVAVAAAVVAACSPQVPRPDADPTSSVPAASSPAPDPTADAAVDAGDVRERGVEVASGSVTLAALAGDGAELATAPLADGATRLTLTTLAVDDPQVRVLALAGPPGAVLEVLDDDSAVLRDGDGGFLAGLGAPRVTGAATAGTTAAAPALTVQMDGPAVVVWTLSGSPGVAGAEVTVELATTAVRTATWAERGDEGGLSLVVVPTDWGRTAGLAAGEGLWAQVAAVGPEAGTPAMHDQLTCHTIGAPDKASWNLEPWRPDVGLLQTLAALCNPE